MDDVIAPRRTTFCLPEQADAGTACALRHTIARACRVYSTFFGGVISAYGFLARKEIPAMAHRARLLPFHAINDGRDAGAADGGAGAGDGGVLGELARNAARGINVCVGKEWYRFPSSFFLPTLPGDPANVSRCCNMQHATPLFCAAIVTRAARQDPT
jgi:hypothetical protein